MSRDISNSDDIIDSRDIIGRIEELEDEMQQAMGEWDQSSELDKPAALQEWEDDGNMDELEALRKLRDEAEAAPGWTYGETLIRESYFTDYIEELIRDCYPMPKELDSGNWPWRHITIDYEAAANEARADYIEVDYDGVTYLIRA